MLGKALLLALAASQVALALVINPPETDIQSREMSVVEGDIEWTGRIFKNDTEPTVLHGDIDSILEQILVLNPEYDADEINPEQSDDEFGVSPAYGAHVGLAGVPNMLDPAPSQCPPPNAS